MTNHSCIISVILHTYMVNLNPLTYFAKRTFSNDVGSMYILIQVSDMGTCAIKKVLCSLSVCPCWSLSHIG